MAKAACVHVACVEEEQNFIPTFCVYWLCGPGRTWVLLVFTKF